jgi:hypothetical protein
MKRSFTGELPNAGESDFSPLTDGWLFMVRNPLELISVSFESIFAVSGCKPSNSDHGWLLMVLAQYLAKSCGRQTGN